MTDQQVQQAYEYQSAPDDYVMGTLDDYAGGAYSGPLGGPYLLEFVDMGKPELQAAEYQNARGDRYRTWFQFEIIEHPKNDLPGWGRTEDKEGAKLRVWHNISLHENADFRPIANALCGGKIPPGLVLGKSVLLGRRMRGNINQVPNKKNPEKTHLELDGLQPDRDQEPLDTVPF